MFAGSQKPGNPSQPNLTLTLSVTPSHPMSEHSRFHISFVEEPIRYHLLCWDPHLPFHVPDQSHSNNHFDDTNHLPASHHASDRAGFWTRQREERRSSSKVRSPSEPQPSSLSQLLTLSPPFSQRIRKDCIIVAGCKPAIRSVATPRSRPSNLTSFSITSSEESFADSPTAVSPAAVESSVSNMTYTTGPDNLCTAVFVRYAYLRHCHNKRPSARPAQRTLADLTSRKQIIRRVAAVVGTLPHHPSLVSMRCR